MEIKTSYSTKPDIQTASAELASSIEPNPNLVLFFSSTRYDLEKLGTSLEVKFPNASIIGCSSSGELISGHVLEGSAVAMGIPRSVVDEVYVEKVRDLNEADGIRSALSEISKKVGKDVRGLDPREYVGIILVDGLRLAEERLMDSLGNACDITWIGGSAGDDLAFKETKVFAQGKAETNAAVLTLLHLPKGFDIIKTQSFTQTGIKMITTEVDEATRRIMSFDGKPAAQRYAEALGVSIEDLQGRFMDSPLGLIANGEPFVRSPQRLEGDKVVFYCSIKKGMELEVLKAGDIVMSTRTDLMEHIRKNGRPKAILNFNCILRTLELKSKGQTKDYGQVFNNVPMLGFSTYGEEYIAHINQTATMLLLK